MDLLRQKILQKDSYLNRQGNHRFLDGQFIKILL